MSLVHRNEHNRLQRFVNSLIQRGIDPSLITQWVQEADNSLSNLISRFAEYEESQINARSELERQANRPYEASPIHERIRRGELQTPDTMKKLKFTSK